MESFKVSFRWNNLENFDTMHSKSVLAREHDVCFTLFCFSPFYCHFSVTICLNNMTHGEIAYIVCQNYVMTTRAEPQKLGDDLPPKHDFDNLVVTSSQTFFLSYRTFTANSRLMVFAWVASSLSFLQVS